MLRTRRPLLALLVLGVLLAGGYLISAVRSDDSSGPAVATAGPGPTGTTAQPSKTGRPTAGPETVRPTATGGTARPSGSGRPDGLRTVAVAALPVEAQRVLRLIDAGGPFPYAQDGTVFGNVERLLPAHPRGWYREYTVPTPGSRDRGARRIIAGQDGARYYTADHYESFARVEGS
ncbi:MAG TPA: ribonuclease domain-containing protein [Mycobacteriales bacterium]|nr:ribonuclease domain-containing protein [Mycobacteriales bacterium]